MWASALIGHSVFRRFEMSNDEDERIPGGLQNLPNTFLFQTRPKPLAYAQCPAGADCCSAWKAQTPHEAMHVALMDASVRTVNPAVSQQTWNYLLLPRDGQTPGNDW